MIYCSICFIRRSNLIFLGQSRVVEFLLANKVDVNVIDYWGKSALMHALCEKKYEIAKLLIENGADINTKVRKIIFSPLK